MKSFTSKLERDTWIQNARDDEIIEYFEFYKPDQVAKARQTMLDNELAEWCRVVADFTVAEQEV